MQMRAPLLGRQADEAGAAVGETSMESETGPRVREVNARPLAAVAVALDLRAVEAGAEGMELHPILMMPLPSPHLVAPSHLS